MQFANMKKKREFLLTNYQNRIPNKVTRQIRAKNTVNDNTVLDVIRHLTNADMYTKLDKSSTADVDLKMTSK